MVFGRDENLSLENVWFTSGIGLEILHYHRALLEKFQVEYRIQPIRRETFLRLNSAGNLTPLYI